MTFFEFCEKRQFLDASEVFLNQSYDLFISGYNLSERVKSIYAVSRARKKVWIVASDYGIEDSDLPLSDYVVTDSLDEGEAIRNSLRDIQFSSEDKICIDSTGFIRQHLLFLIRFLHSKGIKKFDVVYSEPATYERREETKFSKGPIGDVREIRGFEGRPSESGDDLLIIGTGYDSRLVSKVAENRSGRIVQMFGLPSLSADMYQENLYRAQEAADSLGDTQRIFAPANDPFATADILQGEIERILKRIKISTVSLCPLGTKAQSIGFALFHLSGWNLVPTSIIYPFSKEYSSKTSVGISRIWRYGIQFPESNPY